MKKRIVAVAVLAAVSALGFADAALAKCDSVGRTSVCVLENNEWGSYDVVGVYSRDAWWIDASIGDYQDSRWGRGRVTDVGVGVAPLWVGVGEYQSGSNSAIYADTPAGHVEQTTPLPALPRLPRI